MSVKETLKQLESEKTKVLMAELYGAEKAEENRARYRYVAEPTKYYSIEGNNVYFELMHDGEPVDALDYLE